MSDHIIYSPSTLYETCMLLSTWIEPKRNRNRKNRLARETAIKKIERLKILIEKLENLNLAKEITRETPEKIDIETQKQKIKNI